jgi:methionyl-tRNA synthetase
MPEKFYVTTPIYYVNARPHIGHAYTTIVADVLARRHRLLGDDTFFLTGTDEHGQKIERSAAAAGIPPQAFADEVSESFRTLWKRMGITNDAYIRTTDAAHKRGVQKLFSTLYERGAIYLSSYTGQYCVSEEMFVEGPPGTIGPDGRPTETVTEENFFFRLSDYQLPLLDLIESDTLKITPESRKNEVLSFLGGNVVEAIRAAGETLTVDTEGLRLLGDNDARRFVELGILKESKTGRPYVPGALKDLSISRSSFTWGIPVPEPAASAAKEKHVIYVWLDALANYMTALGYGSEDPAEKAHFEKYWPADLHLVGKEIIRFHCIYWPAFLLAADLPLPKAVTAHGWLLFEDSKMSKSKGNIVRTETILDAFGTLCPAPSAPSVGLSPHSEVEGSASPIPAPEPSPADRDLFAADILRYFLLREIPFGQDGSFSFDAVITRYNADLANGYGNLVSRTLSMIHQNFKDSKGCRLVPSHPDLDVISFSYQTSQGNGLQFSAFDFEREFNIDFDLALREIMRLVSSTDQYLSDTAPWKIAKNSDDASKRNLTVVLYTAAESIRIITALLYPILPHATANVWRQLGLGDIEAAAKNGELKDLKWGDLKPGTKLGPLSPIFPRADKGLAQIMSDMEQNAQAAKTAAKPTPSTFVDENFAASPMTHLDPTHPAAAPRTGTLSEPNPGLQVAGSNAETTERVGTPHHSEAQSSGIFGNSATQTVQPTDASPQITIDDFAKVELRVAKVLVCERIPKADKLLRLEVDLGFEKRQILSGIAEWYTPEDLIGRRIVVITNLAPRKMRGLESHGMLLAASASEGGKPALATFLDSDDLPLGSRLK